MPTRVNPRTQRLLDVRPDRIDLRDRPYRPPLVSLPLRYPSTGVIEKEYESYRALILDQGEEGACTGFGLAAVINYLIWRRELEGGRKKKRRQKSVSPWMLYHLARFYDEWAGEDYEGSSCRGAMKGWHKHGVCIEKLWPAGKNREGRRRNFVPPLKGWDEDAATRPLGAYYRIDKDSLVDMQAAIVEVGAIFCSAETHEGWDAIEEDQQSLRVIPPGQEITGGHAFAIVGYTPDGFIVQNSWGSTWGYCGFAVLGWDDWIRNGLDAWVAVMGAPFALRKSPATRSKESLAEAVLARRPARVTSTGSVSPTIPLDEHQAREVSILLGNDGRPLNEFVECEGGIAAVERVALTNAADRLRSGNARAIVVYAHGGLNSESAGLARTRVMAPPFTHHGLFPIFINWRTGFLESLVNIGEDYVADVLGLSLRSEGILDRFSDALDAARDAVAEARDRALEVAFEKILVKAIWTQMKQNAESAAAASGGLAALAVAFAKLKREFPQADIHLVGHSAGSILLGHLLDGFAANGLQAASMHLYAPACTVDFACAKFGGASSRGILGLDRVFVDVLCDEHERADTVGPYGKSLLYLVSRALERVHKTPLLGMHAAWQADADEGDLWHRDHALDLRRWRELFGDPTGRLVATKPNENEVSNGRRRLRVAHGSFDNDVVVVARTLSRIVESTVDPNSLLLDF